MRIIDVFKSQKEKLQSFNIQDLNLKLNLILENVLNVSKEYLRINYEEEFPEEKLEELDSKINRLTLGEPIQYIINSQEFFGFKFYVDKNVLIPQPDTEILVEEVIDIAKKQNKPLKILDLCTGSGAIAISLMKKIKNVEVYASDISKEALNIARKNAILNDCDITFIESDLFENINEKIDIIVSNPPYIETDVLKDLSDEVKHEPIVALDGKEDGLFFYKKIAQNAKELLEDKGFIAFEIGYNQKESVIKILENNNYKNIYSKKDLSGNDRIVIGNKN